MKKASQKKAKKPLKSSPVSKSVTPKQKKQPKSKSISEPLVFIPPANPTNLGTKRCCPKCSAKFYDFARTPIQCPKCLGKFEPGDFKSISIPRAQPKKIKDKPVSAVEGVHDESIVITDDVEPLESLEDLSEEEDSKVVEEINTSDDADDSDEF